MPAFIYHNDYFTYNGFSIKQASEIVEVWIVGDSLVLLILRELLSGTIDCYSISTSWQILNLQSAFVNELIGFLCIV
jgi:hypothetical protein